MKKRVTKEKIDHGYSSEGKHKKRLSLENQHQKEVRDYVKEGFKRLPIVFNRWGEGRCPGCDMELYYAWVYEICNEGKELIHEECKTIITPLKK
jgi:hypothetical protein